jgi:acetoin utilization deacetylase AcuC-like enzyme
MRIIYSHHHHYHRGTELKNGKIQASVEQPNRAEIILKHIQSLQLGEITAPRDYPISTYYGVHSPRYVRFLSQAWKEWVATGKSYEAFPLVWPVRDLCSDKEPHTIEGKLGFYAMDAGVPITSGTWTAVRSSANLALTGADLLSEGDFSAFALCRPPGHHAASEYMGGYCYLNNAALAAQRLREKEAPRVAILDIDYHHGNGTQSIFYARNDVLVISIHGEPQNTYPYFSGYADEKGDKAGLGFNHNYPLPHGTTWLTYQAALSEACKQLMVYAPAKLVVSLGVDTFEQDPISHFKLKTEDYLRLGTHIRTLNIPTLFVMEGGYKVEDLGRNVANVLQGFESC